MESPYIIEPNKLDPSEYTTREVVRCVVLNETETQVLFFGNVLVGGGVEEGESDEEAIARECMEEAGARVQILKYLGEVIGYREAIKKKYVMRGYLCKQVGELQQPTTTIDYEQNIEAKWIEIPMAINKLEQEIKDLESQEKFDNDDLQDGRIKIRKISLYFLKKYAN